MQTVSAIQMCSSSHIDDNLAQAERLITQAVDAGAQLVVLPEMFAILGCHMAERVGYQETAGSGKTQDFLSELAASLQVWIVGGTIPLASNTPGKTRAACLVFADNGQPVARYDKIHMFDVRLSDQENYCESTSTEPGDTIALIETPIGKLGIAVCFDIRFPHIFSELSAQGVEVLAVPAAFAVKTGHAHWEVLLRCRALDTLSYVIAAGQSGHHPNGRITYGHSMIVNPWGNIIAEQKESGSGVVSADVDLGKLYEVRKVLPVVSC